MEKKLLIILLSLVLIFMMATTVLAGGGKVRGGTGNGKGAQNTHERCGTQPYCSK